MVRAFGAATFNGGNFLCGNPIDGGIRVAAGAVGVDSNPLQGFFGWVVQAPPNTTIQEIQFERSFDFRGSSNQMLWRVRKSEGGNLESVSAGTVPPANGVVSLSVNGSTVTGTLSCSLPGTMGCMGGAGSLTVVTSKNFFVRAADQADPTISVTPPSPTTPLRGTVEIPYEAKDLGSGVAAVSLILPGNGGQLIGESRDENGGKCREPFQDLLPCRLEVSRSISFDTTKVPNGPHTIALVVADASRNLGFTAALPVVVDNPAPPLPPVPGGNPGRGNAPRPETTIGKHPPKRTSSRRARFTFSAADPSARFECKLDRGPFKACSSPFKRKVRPGSHSFKVRALDAGGNADLSPAAFRWRVL